METYQERMTRVCDYIAAHLEDDLSLEQLSSVASLSKFHFHRLFRDFVGISLYQYVQLLRLKRASYRLVFDPGSTVLDIALEAGFESSGAFSRAFKRNFGQAPSAFRRCPEWEPWHQHYQFPTPTQGAIMQVTIVPFETTPVAVLEHRGAPSRLLETVQQFISWRKATGLSPIASKATFGVCYDDPEGVPPEEFRFDICGAVDAPVPDNPQGVITKTIPGGECAVARHRGSHDLIGETVYYLYRNWLPESGREVRDFPVFFQYLNLFPEVPECDLETDVFLPLKSKS